MQESIRENTDKQQDFDSEKILAGYIASALDTEDRVVESIYVDYMKRDAWPVTMKEEAMQSIWAMLGILLEDTQKHKRILLSLQNELGDNDAD